MITRWLTILSIVSFSLLSLFVLQMTKRPLCIDSKVVERIDRLAESGTETVFRCALNKPTAYSSFFSQSVRDLTYRVQQSERLLESLEPFKQKIQIAILPDRPWTFRVQDHQIYIGEKLLEAPGHLEKALAKVWYRERSEVFFAQQNLLEEVITDFIIYLQAGDLEIGDPQTRVMTALRRVKWPYVIKSVPDYCESPWKRSEHYTNCYSKKVDTTSLENEVVDLSLRPLLVAAWVESYKMLSMNERFHFSQAMSSFVGAGHTAQLPLTISSDLRGESGSILLRASEAIKNLSAFVATSNILKSSANHRQFMAHLTNELRNAGFQEAFVEASFDVLFVSPEKLSNQSMLFKQVLSLSKTMPDLQIAVRDSENLWMLPAKSPISLKSFGNIRAHRTVVEKCGGYSFSYVLDYADVAEKLLVVDHCDTKKEIQYGDLLKKGTEGFALQNPGTVFVQFHLPSLMMRKSDLADVSDVFDFIQNRNVESTSFKSLGWTEVRWDKKINAYQPKAFVDAIEWYRVRN